MLPLHLAIQEGNSGCVAALLAAVPALADAPTGKNPPCRPLHLAIVDKDVRTLGPACCCFVWFCCFCCCFAVGLLFLLLLLLAACTRLLARPPLLPAA